MKKEITTSIILEKRKQHSDKRYPVKLRVTFRGKSKYYTCFYNPEDAKVEPLWEPGGSIAMSEPEFKTIMDPGSRGLNKLKRVYLTKLESTAQSIIRSLGSRFTLDTFGKKYLVKQADSNNLITGLRNTGKELRGEERIPYAVFYEYTAVSFEKFMKGRPLPFEDITPALLSKYEKWMLSQKVNDKGKVIQACNLTTVGMYLRNVRTEYRKARDGGIFQGGDYPFGKGKYKIPGGHKVKKALTQKEVASIANYKPILREIDQRHRDYWLFCYLCNGINVKDMSRLKYSNIDSETITFIRSKTQRETKETPSPIVIIITRQIGRIIDRWGNKPGTSDQYLFPVLQPGMTPEQEYNTILQTIRDINTSMKEIAGALELSKKVTTYTARHTFATVLKRSGASTEFISESLGHRSTKTTANYLDNFEYDVKREWAEKLLPETHD